MMKFKANNLLNNNKEITYLKSKEYDNFINTMVSVVEKYGVEILEEIECAV